MPRKTGSRTGARSAASSAETWTWLFRWFQRARGPDARAPHPIDVMANTIVPSPRKRGEGTCRSNGLRAALTGYETIIWAKGQSPRRGGAKRRHWRDTNGDRAQNKGGRPGAARRSGPAMFDFANGAEAARRAPSEWLRRSDKRRPHMRA